VISRSAVVLVVAAVLAACASTHGLKPEATLQKADSLAATTTLSGATVDPAAWPESDWWTQFHDPQLNELIAEGLAGSPTLKVAEARTRAALAQAQVANSARLPQVDAKADITRERFPNQSLIPPPYAGTWDNFSELSTTLNWEIDLWGKNRAAYEAAVVRLGRARWMRGLPDWRCRRALRTPTFSSNEPTCNWTSRRQLLRNVNRSSS